LKAKPENKNFPLKFRNAALNSSAGPTFRSMRHVQVNWRS